MTDRPARCPRCDSPDPAFTKLSFGGAYAHFEHLVSGWGHPLCTDAWHDGHRPWYDEWKAKQARFQPTPPPLYPPGQVHGHAPAGPFITEETP